MSPTQCCLGKIMSGQTVHGLRELEQTILSEAVILLGEAVCPGVSKQCSHAEVEVCRPELSREQGSSLQQVRGGD